MEIEKIQFILKNTSYPTIVLFLISLICWLFSLAFGLGIILPYNIRAFNILGLFFSCYSNPSTSLLLKLISIPITIISLIISTLSCYAMFTVTHDSIHRAISKNVFINDTIGLISSMGLGPTTNWYAVKKNHLLHHAHTNDYEKDPDMWCSEKGPGGKKLMLFRWMTMDISYWYVFITTIHKYNLKLLFKMALYEIIPVGILYLGYQYNFLDVLFQYWILPSRISIFMLAYLFDYLPHSPHETIKIEDKYKTTVYLSAPWYIKPFLSLLIFYQNYHVIHHLEPRIPFYEYKKRWEQLNSTLINEKGVPITEVFPILSIVFGDKGKEDILVKFTENNKK